MTALLTASLIGNAALLVACAYFYFRCQGKPLPRRKPDFDSIELALSRELTRRSLTDVVELTRFECRDWICRATLTHYVADIHAHWHEIIGLLTAVSRQCGVPARPAGWAFDPTEPDRMTGTIVEFGYSRETGYHHSNEFAHQQHAAVPRQQSKASWRSTPKPDPRITVRA